MKYKEINKRVREEKRQTKMSEDKRIRRRLGPRTVPIVKVIFWAGADRLHATSVQLFWFYSAFNVFALSSLYKIVTAHQISNFFISRAFQIVPKKKDDLIKTTRLWIMNHVQPCRVKYGSATLMRQRLTESLSQILVFSTCHFADNQ